MTTVWITDDVAAALVSAAQESSPMEIGGILVGVERDGEPWITKAAIFAAAARDLSSFVIPEGLTPAVVDELSREDERLGYLGDWHSHPMNVGASNTDRNTLRRVGKRPERDQRPAVLLVIRATGSGWIIDALADDGKKMRQAAVRTTGPLPAPS